MFDCFGSVDSSCAPLQDLLISDDSAMFKQLSHTGCIGDATDGKSMFTRAALVMQPMVSQCSPGCIGDVTDGKSIFTRASLVMQPMVSQCSPGLHW